MRPRRPSRAARAARRPRRPRRRPRRPAPRRPRPGRRRARGRCRAPSRARACPSSGCRCFGVGRAHARAEAGGHDDDCEWTAHAADDGWGARIRTWDRGTKTRCLTTWLRPSERIVSPSAAPRGSAKPGQRREQRLRSLKRTSSATAAKIAARTSAPEEDEREQDGEHGRASARPPRSRTPAAPCRIGRRGRRRRRRPRRASRCRSTVQRETSWSSATRIPSTTADPERDPEPARARASGPCGVEPCSIGVRSELHHGSKVPRRNRDPEPAARLQSALRGLRVAPVVRRARRRSGRRR